MLLRKKGDLKKWVQDVGIDKRGISMETEQLEKIIQGAQKDQMMDDIAVQKAVDFLVGEAK